MKAYGVKRCCYFIYPDVADCLSIGAQSQLMKMHSDTRRSARRYWKKKARSEAKQYILKNTPVNG